MDGELQPAARTGAGRATCTRRGRSWSGRTSCSCGSGWPCCSTTARSWRTPCSPTAPPRTCRPTAWSPAWAPSTAGPSCVVANDPTVKAGSWGARTVEKIVRATEHALRHDLPMVWLVDSAGARITDQVELFPGRRGAGRIFYNQVKLSGTGAADLLPVRAQRRRRRLHPVVLRHRDHGGGQRLHVPGLAPHGGDGDRRAGHARGDGRRPDARHRVGLRRQPRRRRRRRHRAGQGRARPTCRAPGARTRRSTRRSTPARELTRRPRAGRRHPGLRHAHA